MHSQSPQKTHPKTHGRWLTPAATAAAVHILIVTAAALAFGDDMLRAHDGQHFGALALDPLLLESPPFAYVAYRASRIAMPALAWPFSWLGAVTALAIVQVSAVWVGTRALTNLAVRRGLSPWLGFAFAVLPGTLISTRVLVADAVAAAFMLAAADAWERGRTGWVWATLAVLSKETMLLAVAGFAFFDWRRAVVPTTALTLWVGSLLARFEWVTPGGTIGFPFVGAVDAVREWIFFERWEEVVGGLGLVVIIAMTLWLAWQLRNPLALSAVATCAIVPLLGPSALRYAIHTQRLVLYPLAVSLLLWFQWRTLRSSTETRATEGRAEGQRLPRVLPG